MISLALDYTDTRGFPMIPPRSRLTEKAADAALQARSLSAVANRRWTPRALGRAADAHAVAAQLFLADGNREAASEHRDRAGAYQVEAYFLIRERVS